MEALGTEFTCFTSTKVQILTPSSLLDALPSLTDLKLSSNEIARIEGVSKLWNLRVLDLSCNRLRTVDNLESLTALQRLGLAHNGISASSAEASASLFVLLYK